LPRNAKLRQDFFENRNFSRRPSARWPVALDLHLHYDFQCQVGLTDNVTNLCSVPRKINTSVSVSDGQTVVFGGLMSENVKKQKINANRRRYSIGWTPFPHQGRLAHQTQSDHFRHRARVVISSGLALNNEDMLAAP
jgi:hypothetical protein